MCGLRTREAVAACKFATTLPQGQARRLASPLSPASHRAGDGAAAVRRAGPRPAHGHGARAQPARHRPLGPRPGHAGGFGRRVGRRPSPGRPWPSTAPRHRPGPSSRVAPDAHSCSGTPVARDELERRQVGGATVRSGAFCDGPCARPRANAWCQIGRRLEDPTESASAAHRRAGSRTRRETRPCAPQCKPVEVGRRDRLPRRARLRRLLRALRRVQEGTTDGARRRTSSRRTYFDRGLALKARSETLAGEFASMTAVPTISGCCGGRPRLPQHLRRKARDPGTRRRPATRRGFRRSSRSPPPVERHQTRPPLAVGSGTLASRKVSDIRS